MRMGVGSGIVAVLAILATPAMAAPEPSTRLVACQSGSCLLVSGRRDDAGALVRINGHAVPVEGQRNWRVRLPIETVREWSAPSARTIDVALLDPATRNAATQQADLPIGLFTRVADLAALVVRVR